MWWWVVVGGMGTKSDTLLCSPRYVAGLDPDCETSPTCCLILLRLHLLQVQKRNEMGKRLILGLSAVENEIQQLQSSLSPTIAYMAGDKRPI